jgi:catechol 2,3-dioxygenase-like lactoylglutathione lyase family enzyme
VGAPFHHLDLNVRDLATSEAFYREVLGHLGMRELERGEGWVSFGDEDGYLTLVQTAEPFLYHGFHRKRIGVNHVALRAPSREAVDELHAWLMERGIRVLYGGPIDRGSELEPYYAVYFEDPDRFKLEYAYRPRGPVPAERRD